MCRCDLNDLSTEYRSRAAKTSRVTTWTMTCSWDVANKIRLMDEISSLMLTVPEQQKTEPLQRVGLLFYYVKQPFTTLQGTCPADTDTFITTTYTYSQVVSHKRFIQRKKEREPQRQTPPSSRYRIGRFVFWVRNCKGRVLDEIESFCQLETLCSVHFVG